jgi:hypothetical protein
LRVRALAGETLATPLAARLALWLHGAITLYYVVQPWSSGRSASFLGSALGALALPALLTATAFFRPTALAGPFAQLARQRGLGGASLQMGVAAARVWLVARPFVVSVPLLWLSALAAGGTLVAWFSALLGVLGSGLFVVGSDAYQRFLTVMSECTRAQLARR